MDSVPHFETAVVAKFIVKNKMVCNIGIFYTHQVESTPVVVSKSTSGADYTHGISSCDSKGNEQVPASGVERDEKSDSD